MLRARKVYVRPPSGESLVKRAARWIARRVALLGNLAFLVGSVAFLSDVSQTFGVWLFIVGSAAFLLDGMRGTERAETPPSETRGR